MATTKKAAVRARAPRATPAAREHPAGQRPLAAYEPRHPAVVALGWLSLWVAILSLPMLGDAFLAAPHNDQYSSGYAYRHWAAYWWRATGSLPLWNPEIFAGMPFVAGMHGDVLYPTAFLRLVFPTHVAMNLGFVIHYVLAGMFTYWFLRRWNVSWTGAVVGGVAYQLAGVIGSYVSPGHDGKLFVTAMLPLLLTGLTSGIRDRRLEGYAIAAIAVGLSMLSPHPQMAQYAFMAAGIFTLFLVFGEGSTTSGRDRALALGLSLAAVLVGLGVSAAQYLPFYAYIPYSPRDASVLRDFEFSSSYAIPWAHVPELLIPRFAGESFNRSYWGPNGIKFHSEYLGLAVVALAIVGAFDHTRRRMIVWLLGIGLVFLLVALGASTPFFRLWWEVVPFSKSMRAPGMALFIVAFITATLAALGTDRLMTGAAARFAKAALIGGAVVALLGLSGLLGGLAEAMAVGVEARLGYQGWATQATAAAEVIRWSALGAGLALAAIGALATLHERGALGVRPLALLVIAIVGTDLWLNARAFWKYSHAHETLFAGDAVKAHLANVPRPFRVWDVEVYPGAALMAHNIAQLYGHHGNELHSFDQINARQGTSLNFSRAGDPRILEMFAINWLIVNARAAPDSLPGYRRVLSNVATSAGVNATLFERETPVPYAKLVPAAVPATQEQTIPTVVDQRFADDRVVLLDSLPAGRPSAAPDRLPAPVNATIGFEEWRPGYMRMRIDGGAPAQGYVVVSENYYPDWRATVDGRPVRVARGNGTLVTVPVEAGARQIELRYVSDEFATGKAVSLASLGLIALGVVVPPFVRRRQKPMSSRGA